MSSSIQSFAEFWPFYVTEHASKTNRTLHFAGTSAAMACVAGAVVLRRPSLLLAALVAGYAPAWTGHFFVEKNRPASFKHPLWSLRADLVMWTKILGGTMDAEVERAVAAAKAAAEAPGATNGTHRHDGPAAPGQDRDALN